MRYRSDKWIFTNEDWYPTVEGRVKVSLVELKSAPAKFRVCVWGGDDFGLEKDYESFDEAFIVFDRIVSLVTQRQLRNWGFGNA